MSSSFNITQQNVRLVMSVFCHCLFIFTFSLEFLGSYASLTCDAVTMLACTILYTPCTLSKLACKQSILLSYMMAVNVRTRSMFLFVFCKVSNILNNVHIIKTTMKKLLQVIYIAHPQQASKLSVQCLPVWKLSRHNQCSWKRRFGV